MKESISDIAAEIATISAQLEALACYVDGAYREPPTVDRVSAGVMCDTLRAAGKHLARITDDLSVLDTPNGNQ